MSKYSPLLNTRIDKKEYNYGVDSICKDGKHILMLDSDIPMHILECNKSNLKKALLHFNLYGFFIFSTRNGFHIVDFTKMSIEDVYQIGKYINNCDNRFLDIGFKKGFYTLRVGKDIRLHDVILNPLFKYRELSRCHYLFYRDFFNIPYINKTFLDLTNGNDVRITKYLRYDKNG